MAPPPRYQRMLIGAEQQPLLIIDDLMPQAESLIDYALAQNNVVQAPGLYPGLRSPAPALYTSILKSLLMPALDWFGFEDQQPDEVNAWFSLVATPAEQLDVRQRVPHFDRADPRHLAVIHYLCDGKFGGTSFYRHRATGFEFIDTTRMTPYLEKLRIEAQTDPSITQAAYINGSTALFERIASVECRFNRAVAYRGFSLHSGNIGKDYRYDLNPRTGRFTVASFISINNGQINPD